MSSYDRVLITGGGGMLAKALVLSLAAHDAQPTVLDRASLDVTDASQVIQAFREYSPRVVINCAAFTKVDLCEQEQDTALRVNGGALVTLATMSALHDAKLIHYSTDFVFDGNASSPYPADAATNPLSEYGRSKLAGERAVQNNPRLQQLIIRTAWLYGPGGPNFVQTMLNLARAGKPVRVVNDQIGAPTFTNDLAEATLKLIDHGATGIWHVTNGGQTSWFGFAQAIFEEFGVKADLQPISSEDWKKLRPNSAIRPKYSVLDIEPYAKLTGAPMRHWRDALREYRRIESQPS
jgi:dTDP-4-dehydrorhamnose reductase